MYLVNNIRKSLFSVFILAVPLLIHAEMRMEMPAQDSIGHPDRKGQGQRVSGTVVDASSGLPLTGINVSIEDYSASITDEKGTFSIDVPSLTEVLLLSGTGYQTKTVALKGRKDLRILLYEESFHSVHDEIGTTLAAGRQSQVYSASSVSAVNVKDAWTRPFETPDNYLQGQMPGLQVNRRSGTPGIGANMFMRGFSSLYATNQPLVVVDGMVYDANSYGTSLISAHVNNPLSLIDMKDIENFTVLKDGTSLYGTRGANGVIFISTAHAKELATKIDLSVYGGVNAAPQRLPVMNVDDYRLYLSDLLQSSGIPLAQIASLPYMNDDVSSPDYYRYHYNTNWQDRTLGNSYDQNYYLKVTGGDNIAKYALSLGYLNNSGIIDNTDLKRYTARFNADFTLTQKLTAVASLAFTSGEQSLKDQGLNIRTNPVLLGLIKSPFLPVFQVDDNGNESPNLADTDVFNVSNPMSVIGTMNGINKNSRFFGSVRFNYQLGKYGNIGSLVGLSYDKVRESTFIPRLGVTPDTLSNAVAYNTLGSRIQRYSSLYNDTYYSWGRKFNSDHTFQGNIGFRYQHAESEQDRALGYNSPSDDFVTIGFGTNSLRQIGGDIGKWRWLNTYLGMNYAYRSKYLLSFNLSVDGSSRFGKEVQDALTINGNQYAVLPSVAAAWLISSESFMAGATAVELLKIRLSYGLTGNDDIGNYSARRYYVSQNLLGAQGLIRGNIGNPYLQWETNKKLNAGADLSLFGERFSLSVDAYRNRTSNLITYGQLATGAGFDFVIANNGSMKNEGIEAALNARLLNRTVKWDVGATISSYRNRVTSLPENRSIITTVAGTAVVITRPGAPVSQFYGFKTNGVFRSDAEAADAGQQIRTAEGNLITSAGGDIRFADLNNDGIIDDDDRTVIGDPNPDFFGSFHTALGWKRFSVNALFTFSKGNDVYNGTRAVLESVSQPMNQTLRTNNRWQYDGQQTDVPKATYGDPVGNARFSDRWIEDGSYLRLRSLYVTYNLPVKPGFLKNATLYATGNNLFTVTKYLGYDPEMSLTASPLSQGFDLAQEPQFRSVQFGVRIGL